MLICHQCQAENPNNHRFCQACGASLTQVECLNCGAMVDCGAKSCPVCDAVIGRQLYAIIARSKTAESGAIATNASSNLLPDARLPDLAPLDESDRSLANMQPGDYLDPQQRYQIGAIVASEIESATESDPIAADRLEAVVFDQRPLELSPVQMLKSHVSPLDDEAKAKLPGLAQTYFGLEVELAPATPYLHDAWQCNGTTVLLVEDRSDWLAVTERGQDSDLEPLLVLRWLLDSLQLWQVLGEWRCRQSLLNINNLCLDEDDCLCLRLVKSDVTSLDADAAQSLNASAAQLLAGQAVSDWPDQLSTGSDTGSDDESRLSAASLDLSALGRVWQMLVQHLNTTLPKSVHMLCDQLIQREIKSVDAVRSQLSAIAETLQAAEALVVDTLNQNLDFETVEYQPLNDPLDDQSSDPLASGITDASSCSTSELETADGSARAASNPLFEDSPPNPDGDFYSTWDEEDNDDEEDSPTVVLPMSLLGIEDGGRTDIGRRRDHNEDAFSIQLDLSKVETATERTLHARGLYLICDGMGGHAGGEIASALALDVLRKYFATHWRGPQLPPEQTIIEAIRQANQAIYEENQQNERLGSGRMGTTLVMLLLQDTHALVAHVGDSRLYRFSRRLGLQQLTTDHEVGQREIQRGVEADIAYGRPDAYQLTQALGPRDDGFVVPDIEYLELSEDTLLLLCSDGLSDNDLLETHWHSHVEPLLNPNQGLDEGINALIDLGNRHNGHDNITAIAVRVKVRPKTDAHSRTTRPPRS